MENVLPPTAALGGLLMGFIVFIFQFLPRRIISSLMGKFFALRWPDFLRGTMCRLFVHLNHIDMREAEHEIDAYQSIEAIFSRRLKQGARAIASEVCAPVDGFLSCSEAPTGILGFQAKGYYYSLRELIYGEGEIEFNFEPAWYMNFYLAPHNYHRVHCPLQGELQALRWIHGDKWPVQQGFRNAVTRLYVRNERKVFRIQHTATGGQLFVVMVAALGVGNMVVTAVQQYEGTHRSKFEPGVQLAAGAELGYFTLGSTVILVFDKVLANAYNFITPPQGMPIKMGTSVLKQ